MPPDRVNEEPGILARIRRGEPLDHYETIRQRKDGTLLDISLNVSPIYNEDGVIVGASKIARDITDRKRNEAELAKLAAIVQSASDAIISKDLNGIITSWNNGAEAIFGYTPDEAIGQPGTMLMPPERIDEEPALLARIRQGEAVDHYETIRRHKDGNLLNLSLNISPIYDAHGVIVGSSKIARDITVQKRAEAAIRETEIMQRLIDAQEAERHRIARDLHDHLGQQMTALRLKVASLIQNSGESVQQPLLEIREMAFRMDRDIGYLSWQLRPMELEHFGLAAALRTFVYEWSDQSGIPAIFEAGSADAALRLPETSETNLYRIVQEALNNVAKHAQATNVTVLLHRGAQGIVLIIEDDGIGFETRQNGSDPHKITGLGVVGMRERAALLKGTLEMESDPGKGTTILVRVPISQPAGHA
jgi:PAS domain S-box-containing protein